MKHCVVDERRVQRSIWTRPLLQSADQMCVGGGLFWPSGCAGLAAVEAGTRAQVFCSKVVGVL